MKSHPGRGFLVLVGGLVFSLLSGCLSDRVVPATVAGSRIQTALLARFQYCDQGIEFLIPVPHDVEERLLQSCEDELLISSCPLTDPPPSCILVMIKEAPHSDADGL